MQTLLAMSLKLNHDGGEIHCPHCHTLFGYEWDDGEYNSIEVGVHSVECLEDNCLKRFTVEAYMQISSHK